MHGAKRRITGLVGDGSRIRAVPDIVTSQGMARTRHAYTRVRSHGDRYETLFGKITPVTPWSDFKAANPEGNMSIIYGHVPVPIPSKFFIQLHTPDQHTY